jgi:hypothetical protein
MTLPSAGATETAGIRRSERPGRGNNLHGGIGGKPSSTRVRAFWIAISTTSRVLRPISRLYPAGSCSRMPAVISSSTQTVICPTTSALRSRAGRNSLVKSPLAACITLVRVACIAGAKPNNNADASAAASMKQKTRTSGGRGATLINWANSGGRVANMTRTPRAMVA